MRIPLVMFAFNPHGIPESDVFLVYILQTSGSQPFGPHRQPVVRRPPVGDRCFKQYIVVS